MKIGLAHKRLDQRGGTELDLYRTAIGLRDQGHEVHLFCSEFAIEPPPGVSKHAIPVVPLGRTARLWSFASAAPKVIRSLSCDVVVNFGRMISQDVLRSGGGSHRGFLQRLGQENSHRRLWHNLSPYHRSLLALERQQFQPGHYRDAIRANRQPKCSGHDGMKAVEMVMAVYRAGLSGKRIEFPLAERKHPLEK
jgi:UDP-glucose:(heptosyl)LPS alpha-1,3-glucosyltransferase